MIGLYPRPGRVTLALREAATLSGLSADRARHAARARTPVLQTSWCPPPPPIERPCQFCKKESPVGSFVNGEFACLAHAAEVARLRRRAWLADHAPAQLAAEDAVVQARREQEWAATVAQYEASVAGYRARRVA